VSFYAIILDWDYQHTNPMLRLIATDPNKQPLEAINDRDPAGSYSSIIRSAFQIAQVERHNIRNDYDGTVNDAHICQVTANAQGAQLAAAAGPKTGARRPKNR
jgi:myo-inositol-hexaphosphate 3-phosphohydrolase